MSEPLRDAWDQVAGPYDATFGPRFAPWAALALEVLADDDLPDGPVLVPCCGPGRSVAAAAERWPQRVIIGLDLSAQMLALARRRCASMPGVRLRQADCASLDGLAPPAAGLLSCFGLQQLPEPDRALADWCRALAPGGRLAVVFWTPDSETEGPWATASRLLDARLGRAEATWPQALGAAVSQAGCRVIQDRRVAFPIRYRSGAALWSAMVDAGPWRALANRQGADFMAELRADFLTGIGPGGVQHSPAARLILAQR